MTIAVRDRESLSDREDGKGRGQRERKRKTRVRKEDKKEIKQVESLETEQDRA